MVYDVGIIGSGPAGLTAALYLARAGKTVCIIEGNSIGGQLAQSPCIENYPGFMGTGYELAMAMYDQVGLYNNVTIELVKVQTVHKLSDGSFSCYCEDGNIINAQYIIDTAGMKHKTLPCIKGEMNHVHYCATCDGLFYKDKKVAVIGDGNTALQYALELSNYCSSVTLITMFDMFFGEPILIKRVLANSNIHWIKNSSIEMVKEVTDGISLVDQNSVARLFNGVFIAIGQTPAKITLPEDVLIHKGYIVTYTNQETYCPGFYAAGDCIYKDYRQVTLATAEGTLAALDIIKRG